MIGCQKVIPSRERLGVNVKPPEKRDMPTSRIVSFGNTGKWGVSIANLVMFAARLAVV